MGPNQLAPLKKTGWSSAQTPGCLIPLRPLAFRPRLTTGLVLSDMQLLGDLRSSAKPLAGDGVFGRVQLGIDSTTQRISPSDYRHSNQRH
jgi:hypothetical protein